MINFVEDNFPFKKVAAGDWGSWGSRIWGNNILDFVLCSDDNLIKNLEIGEKLSTSDHYIVRFD